jgi:hypothetical protein
LITPKFISERFFQQKMVKRKSLRKLEAIQKKNQANTMPLPSFLLKLLAVFLSVILLIALTLYVLGRMSGRGFFSLAILLAIIAFVVMPFMRKKIGA